MSPSPKVRLGRSPEGTAPPAGATGQRRWARWLGAARRSDGHVVRTCDIALGHER